MKKIPALEEAIEQKSLVGIYSVFYTMAHGDPNFSKGTFRELLRYVRTRNVEGLMQEFDGGEFEPEEKWDEEYWALVASSLIDNFCEERIDHLEQVGKKVYPVKESSLPKPPDKESRVQKENRAPKDDRAKKENRAKKERESASWLGKMMNRFLDWF